MNAFAARSMMPRAVSMRLSRTSDGILAANLLILRYARRSENACKATSRARSSMAPFCSLASSVCVVELMFFSAPAAYLTTLLSSWPRSAVSCRSTPWPSARADHSVS